MLFDIGQETTYDFVPLKYRNLFLKEIELLKPVTAKSAAYSSSVQRVIEWLDIWKMLYPEANLPGNLKPEHYNQSAIEAVKILQEKWGMPLTGEVEQAFYSLLVSPMAVAFQRSLTPLSGIREAIVYYARQHHRCVPLETFGNEDNNGPWVRAYLNLYETTPKNEWCAGFVCTILDQAFSHFGEDYTEFMRRTGWVPNFSSFAYAMDSIVPYNQAADRIEEIAPGDVFMIYDPTNSLWNIPAYATIVRDRYVHTGLVAEIEGMVITTIEGNKNYGKATDEFPTLESTDAHYMDAHIPANRGGVFSRKFDLSSTNNNVSIIKINV